MTEANTARRRALTWAASQTWAIARSDLDHLLQIAAREHIPDFDAVLARQGEYMRGTENVQLREGGVAIVDVVGPIFRYANLFTRISGATSIEQSALDLRIALESPDVRAVVLHIDSPGGALPGVSEFARQIRAASKPITAYVSGTAASAGYWIAAAAPYVVMSDTAVAGSIGVVAGVRVDEDDKLIEIVSSQSPNKRIDPRSDAGRLQLQRMVDDLAQVFVAAVAGYRKVSVSTVLRDFGAGGMLVGTSAVAAGLADQIGTLEDVIASYTHGGHGPAYERLLKAKNVRSDDVPTNETPITGARWDAVVTQLNDRRRR